MFRRVWVFIFWSLTNPNRREWITWNRTCMHKTLCDVRIDRSNPIRERVRWSISSCNAGGVIHSHQQSKPPGNLFKTKCTQNWFNYLFQKHHTTDSEHNPSIILRIDLLFIGNDDSWYEKIRSNNILNNKLISHFKTRPPIVCTLLPPPHNRARSLRYFNSDFN